MARNEDMDRRLGNWARWKHGAGSGGLGFSSPRFDGVASGTDVRESIVPTSDCEAEETDRGVQALDTPLRLAVTAVYVGSGSAARKAAALGVSERTVQLRIVSADRHLANWITDQRTAASDERHRLELLRRGVTRATDQRIKALDERNRIEALQRDAAKKGSTQFG